MYLEINFPDIRLIPFDHLTYGDQAFSASAPKEWNKLPSSLYAITTLGTFKHALKTYPTSSICRELLDSRFFLCRTVEYTFADCCLFMNMYFSRKSDDILLLPHFCFVVPLFWLPLSSVLFHTFFFTLHIVFIFLSVFTLYIFISLCKALWVFLCKEFFKYRLVVVVSQDGYHTMKSLHHVFFFFYLEWTLFRC